MSGAAEPAGGCVQRQRRGEYVSSSGRRVVDRGAGSNSVEEFSRRRLFEVEKQIRRELGDSGTTWGCRARLCLPEQRGTCLPDSLAVTALGLAAKIQLPGTIDHLQY